MGYSEGVQVLEGHGQLVAVEFGKFFRKPSAVFYPVEKLSALRQLHDDINAVRAVHHVPKPNYAILWEWTKSFKGLMK